MTRPTARWADLRGSLAFLPGVMVAGFAALGIGLVELDAALDLNGSSFVFSGDGSAARTVLSVLAGSLITVAGLTFSITMVALQLTSSQYSPRILRTFFDDRLTQVTIGTFVGTFVYALLVLRSVGSVGTSAGVPRLSVTVASGLGIAAVVLLIVFLHHVSRLIQVSHIVAAIAHESLRRLDALYPERYGVEEPTAAGLDEWRAEPAGQVLPDRPGYVRRVELESLADVGDGDVRRLAVLVCPGDLVSVDTAVLEVWPGDVAERHRDELLAAVEIVSERDIEQDVDFGVRQLADTAIKAMSPAINDPATAVTCISYMRSILVRLAGRDLPSGVRRFPERGLTVHTRRRGFDEYLDALRQLNRYVAGDAWVATELLRALEACMAAAGRCGATERVQAAQELAAHGGRAGARGGQERGRPRFARAHRGARSSRPPAPDYSGWSSPRRRSAARARSSAASARRSAACACAS